MDSVCLCDACRELIMRVWMDLHVCGWGIFDRYSE